MAFLLEWLVEVERRGRHRYRLPSRYDRWPRAVALALISLAATSIVLTLRHPLTTRARLVELVGLGTFTVCCSFA